MIVDENEGPRPRNMVGEAMQSPSEWADEYPETVKILAEAGLWMVQPGYRWVPRWFETAVRDAKTHPRWLPTFPREFATVLRAFYAEAERRRKVMLERDFVRMVRDDVLIPLVVARRIDEEFSRLPELLLRGPGIRQAALAYSSAYKLGGVEALHPLLKTAQEERWANIRVKFRQTSERRRMGGNNWDEQYRIWRATTSSPGAGTDSVKRAFRAGWQRSVRAAQRRVQTQFFQEQKAPPAAKKEAPLVLRCGSCGADALAEVRAVWPNWLDVWDNLSQAQQAALIPGVPLDRTPRPLDEVAREALGFWRKFVKFDPPTGSERADVVANIYAIVALLNDPPAGLLAGT